MRLKLYLAWLLCLAPALSVAATTPPLTLREAIMLALRYNPAVQNAEIQRTVDKFNLRLAQNAYEVNYALTGTANYTKVTQSGFDSSSSSLNLTPTATLGSTPTGAQFSLSAPNNLSHNNGAAAQYNPAVTLSVTQPLLRGFGSNVNMARLYNAQDAELINQLNLQNAVISTITQLINQYAAVAQAEIILKTQALALQNSIATRKQYQALIKAGRNAPADIVQFQADVASQRLALAQQQQSLQSAKLNILATLGMEPGTEINVVQNFKMPALTLPDLKNCIDLALRNNIGYRTQLINLRIQERNYLVAKDQQRWQLDLTASAGTGGGSGGGVNAGLPSLSNGYNKSRQIGLQLSIPIDDLNRQQQVVSSKNSLEQAKIALAATRRQVIGDVTNAYNNLQNQRQQLRQAQEAARLAEANLKIAEVKARYGRISAFEVSGLQTAVTQAQVAQINTEENYKSTLAAFDQTVGLTLQRWAIHLRDGRPSNSSRAL